MLLFLCLDLGDGSFRKGEGDHCRLAPACLCSSLADTAALQTSSIRLLMSLWRLAVTPKALDTAVALLQAVLLYYILSTILEPQSASEPITAFSLLWVQPCERAGQVLTTGHHTLVQGILPHKKRFHRTQPSNTQ